MANYKKQKSESQEQTEMLDKPEVLLKKRVKRIPVSGPRDILTVTEMDPNYHYRFVNDIPGRVEKFLAGGYEVVNHKAEVGSNTVDRGSRLGSAITKLVGNQIVAVLMRIPKEWYVEDQKAKQDNIDALEATMRPVEADYGSLSIRRK